MKLDLTWINLLILFGALQALIFTIIVLFQKKHPGAKFLAAFIFVFAYNGFETFNWSAGLDRHYMFFDLFGFIVIYSLGPSLYLYICTLLNSDIKFSRKQILLHYAAPLFQLITRIGIIIYHLLWINKIITSDVTSMQLVEIMWIYAEPLSVIIFIVYFIASILRFLKYKRENAARLSGKEKQAIVNWIRAILICMTILAVAWPITVVAPDLFKAPFGDHYYPLELALVLFNYWIVYYGSHKVRTIAQKTTSIPVQDRESAIETQLTRLLKSMEEEKRYLDPELTLSKLAEHTGINSKTISAILNQYHQMNFNDFVNSYRVKEVSARLLDPDNQRFTISGMAIESGFNSLATFQRVFKNTTGMTPREYMHQQLQKTV